MFKDIDDDMFSEFTINDNFRIRIYKNHINSIYSDLGYVATGCDKCINTWGKYFYPMADYIKDKPNVKLFFQSAGIASDGIDDGIEGFVSIDNSLEGCHGRISLFLDDDNKTVCGYVSAGYQGTLNWPLRHGIENVGRCTTDNVIFHLYKIIQYLKTQKQTK